MAGKRQNPKTFGGCTKAEAEKKFNEHNITEIVERPGDKDNPNSQEPHDDPSLQCQCGHCQTYRGEIPATDAAKAKATA